MIIAIDPSYSKKIAVAWFDSGIKYKSLLKNKDYELENRDIHQICLKVFEFLCILIGDTKSTVVIEGQWLGVNAKVFAGLIEIRCLITGMLLAKYGDQVRVITLAPPTWQVMLKGTGKVKEKSIKIASDLVKATPTEDESDAICMLQFGINMKLDK
jgi:hypothetical protein